MLEVLARRHYLGYELHDLRQLTAAGRPFVVADYALDERPTRLITTIAQSSGAGRVLDLVAAIDAQIEDAPASHAVVVDLYQPGPMHRTR